MFLDSFRPCDIVGQVPDITTEYYNQFFKILTIRKPQVKLDLFDRIAWDCIS